MYVVLVLDPTSFSFVEHCAMNLSLFPRFFLSHTFSFTFSLFHSSIFIAATTHIPYGPAKLYPFHIRASVRHAQLPHSLRA
jgi:hypothetical protein